MKSKLYWWTILVTLSVVIGLFAQKLAIPGGWFVATMIIAILAGIIHSNHPKVNKPFLMIAQAVIGTMLGTSVRPDVFPLLLHHFPEVIGVIVYTIGIGFAAGIILPRISTLSRETAAMGSLPGGASAMIALSIGTEADTKIVALMQYLRLVTVVLLSSLVAKILTHHSIAGAPHFPGASSTIVHHWYDYAVMPIIAVCGVIFGKLIRLPTATLLGPMLLGLAISFFHFFHPVWPAWIPPLVYIIMGLYVGLLFDRESLSQAGRQLPLLLANTFILIIMCALAGMIFSRLLGTSLLSGYLATSPGGGDTISIIAFGAGADVSLIFAVQIFRVLIIMLAGSYLTNFILHISSKHMKNNAEENDLM